MIVDRKWIERNLGFDPISKLAPPETFSFTPAAVKSAAVEDFQREIIDFDSEAPEGRGFLAFMTATGLSRFTDISWPAGLAPKTDSAPGGKAHSIAVDFDFSKTIIRFVFSPSVSRLTVTFLNLRRKRGLHA